MCFPVFVVRHELGALHHIPLVDRVLNAAMHFNDNGLLHFRTRVDSVLFLVVPYFFLSCFRFFCHWFNPVQLLGAVYDRPGRSQSAPTGTILSPSISSTAGRDLSEARAFSSATRSGP